MDVLKTSIEEVKKKTKNLTYNPEIIYLVVNKRVNSRFFRYAKQQIFNPDPGSVVVEEMSIDDRFDFHLVAQRVTQGTSTPSHYVVVYDSSKIPQEDLIRFTYEQCYNYYNWQGSVKVPACLQCANKLSKLAGEYIQKQFVEKKETKVNESFFFL
jgi:aubergine-like protein